MLVLDLPLLAPAALFAGAAACFSEPGRRPRAALLLAELSALTALASAVVCAVMLAATGAGVGSLVGLFGAGLEARVDAVSITMLVLVTFIGWIVLRYASTYLDGEDRQGAFTGWLCLTLAAVLLLVTAGNLVQLVASWIATSLFLHRLLIFYHARPGARRVARKKFVTARLGDIALIIAAVLLGLAYRTSDIGQIWTPLGMAKADGSQ